MYPVSNPVGDMWMFTNMGLTNTRATIYLPVGALVVLLMEKRFSLGRSSAQYSKGGAA